MSEWHSGLSFSNRLDNVVAITSALRAAFPDASLSDARSHATSSESGCYNASQSKDEYESRCREEIQTLLKLAIDVAPKVEAVEEEKEERGADGSAPTSIGPFRKAFYYEHGLFSTVYKTRDEDGKALALKATTPSIMAAPHNSQREARILAHVSQQAVERHIVPLLRTFEYESQFVLVFPFLAYDLAQLMQNGSLSFSNKQGYLQDLFKALQYLHSLGIIHRDVKPSNILLASPSGPAYLADFGIAWAPDDPDSEPNDCKITDVGTTCYRPPELLFGNTAYDTSLDMWAAGCVVAEIVGLEQGTLFEPGPAGSELGLIKSIFTSLGTPTLDVWPEAAKFSTWGKMAFKEFPRKPWTELLPGATAELCDLVSRLVCYQSTDRLTATEVLQHPFFQLH